MVEPHRQIERLGYALVPAVLAASECDALAAALGPTTSPGRRGLLAIRAISALANSPKLLDLVRPYTTGEPRPVRAIFFNKSPDANWLVAWHQDLTIAVRARIEVPGFGPWSTKDVVPHVQPPVELLEQMLTVRLHLGAADATNGALRVLPVTHHVGRLTPDQIEVLRRDVSEVTCEAAVGDALLMRPLLLHASSRANVDRPRRVIHIEYAGCELPGGLSWPWA